MSITLDAPITEQDRDAASAVAKPRQLASTKGTGIYPVTVGGETVGSVYKVDSGDWNAQTDSGEQVYLPGTAEARTPHFSTRALAAAYLGRTDLAVWAYRKEAVIGTFGAEVQRAELGRIEEANPAQAPEEAPLVLPKVGEFVRLVLDGRTATGWVKAVSESATGTPQIHLARTRRGRRARLVVSWSEVRRAQVGS